MRQSGAADAWRLAQQRGVGVGRQGVGAGYLVGGVAATDALDGPPRASVLADTAGGGGGSTLLLEKTRRNRPFLDC